MKHPEAGTGKYTVAISTLLHAVEQLNSLSPGEFGSFEDLVDADCTAAAYEQIAEALENLRAAGVPFETITKRLEGIPLLGEIS